MESDDEYQDEIQESFLFDESFVGLHLNRTPLFSSSDANAEVKMSSAVACTTKNADVPRRIPSMLVRSRVFISIVLHFTVMISNFFYFNR